MNRMGLSAIDAVSIVALHAGAKWIDCQATGIPRTPERQTPSDRGRSPYG